MVKRLAIISAVVVATCAVTASSIGAMPTATTIKQGGSTGLQLLATALANAYNKKQSGVRVTVVGGGSGAGIKGAANGTFDIGDSSRDPVASDPNGLIFTKVSREPFVIIVNPKNKVKSLTLAQIKSILTGGVRNWSQVGWGGGGPIKVYGRIATSGTFASCKKFFTDGAEYRSDAPALASNGLDRAAVSRERSGISCVTLPYLTTSGGKVRGVAVGGVAPTLQNAASGRYKQVNYQYFVTKGQPSGVVKTYINWVLSKPTQCSIVSNYALPIANC